MKRLYLLRHAKSSWGDPSVPDHDRTLNERGRRAAAAMGRHLGQRSAAPDVILASTALRVGETLDILLPAAAWDTAVVRERGLYLAEAGELLTRVHNLPTDAASAMIVGHNPGLQDFALRLAGEVTNERDRARRDDLKERYPTAALASLAFPHAAAWREISWGDGRLEAFVAPRSLPTHATD